MKSLQENQSDTDQLTEIVDQITALVDVERIYIHKSENTDTCHALLIILIANACTKSPNELLPLVSIVFHELETFRFTLHPAHQIKDAIDKGNLYFYGICTDDKLVYQKAGSDYVLLPASLTPKQMLQNAGLQYDSEKDKIQAFINGADFYFENENFAQSAFMLHQAIELNYRAIEHFITGRSKITHSVKIHQKYLEPYHTGLGSIFSPEREGDMELLNLLDQAYLAVRYENSYQISKTDVMALRVKVTEVKLAALEVYQHILKNFLPLQFTDKPPEEATQTDQRNAASTQTDTGYHIPVSMIEQITCAFDVERIYCFGKRLFSSCRSSPFSDIENEGTRSAHYDLLVITSSEPGQDPADLQSKINNDTENECTVLLLVYSAEAARLALSSNNRFFHEIMRQAEQVHVRGAFEKMLILPEYDLSRVFSSCQINWQKRYFRAQAFIDAAECIWVDQDETVVLSLISQAVEQLCLGLIYVFLGYRPKKHFLNHLLDLCSNFTDQVDQIFPRRTEQDKHILGILGKGVYSVRFVTKPSVDPTDCGLLHRRAGLLMKKSNQLVEQKLLTMDQAPVPQPL